MGRANRARRADLADAERPSAGRPLCSSYAGLRWLTDPTFSAPGEYAGGLVRTSGPAIAIDELGTIDVVLVSHDHHSDNLDPAGRDLLPLAGHVFTTKAGAGRLGGGMAILFAGAAQPARRFDGAYLTLSSDRAAEPRSSSTRAWRERRSRPAIAARAPAR